MKPVKKTLAKKSPGYEMLKFPSFETKGGILTMLERGERSDKVPFEIKRVLITKCDAESGERGAHTHRESRQIFFVLTGGCTVDLDNGKSKTSVTLSDTSQGLLMEPYVWHVMKNFKENTITLALFNTVYDEKEYIRNYEEFTRCLKK